MKHLFSIFFTISALLAPIHAQFDPFSDAGTETNTEPNTEKTETSLISEVTSAAPGETFTVAIQLKHAAGYHAYYKNPGGPGLPLEFAWKLPEGYEVKNFHWPTPHLYSSGGIQFYVYEGEYVLLADITTPESAKVGEQATITVTPSWQLCNDLGCDPPMSKELSTTITIAEKAQISEDQAAFFKTARDGIPLNEVPWQVTVYEQGSNFVLQLSPTSDTPHELNDVYFISSDEQTNGSTGQKFSKEDGSYSITVAKASQNGNGDDVTKLPHLSGVLISKTGWTNDSKNNGFEFHNLAITKKPLEAAGVGKLLGIIGGMLLGGLILNLMPCVFPVIGLKIMGFAQQAGEEKSKVVMHGITFAAGVLVSFWVLSGLLLTLRNTAIKGEGDEVGWGYQLQNPYIVLTILLLMFILALNMFGVFEIGTKATSVGGDLQNKQGLAGSFFSGVLATVVATPCSAPFLGAAIGAAFALPNFQFMLAFTAMALGLALPYLVLSIFPHLVEKLPRPGPWMESFKQGMSFLLFATAGYLLWVYVAQTGLDYMLNIVLGLSLIALGLWIYGRWNLPHLSTKVKTIAKSLTLLSLIGGILLCLPPNKDNKLTWEKWSEDRVEQLLEDETPVYVDFTATWCATCQLNKKRAYTPEVVQLFKDYGIVALKGDKTNANPEIERKLQELGRTAIPVNVLYIPGKDEPIITPELLSADYMKELITSNLKKPEKE